jgi:molecular chaperone GrpE (heat shock protein)
MSDREEKKHHHLAGEPKKHADGVTETGPDMTANADFFDGGDDPSQKFAETLGRLQAEKDELMQTMIRRQADFENYRKRVEREKDDDRRRGTERLLEDLLPVLDAFDRAVKAHDNPAYEEYRKGLHIIQQQLWSMVTKHGLEKIDAAGKPFDPRFHQAIESVQTTEHAEGTNIEVLQDGYLFHGRVLRPSIVRVAAAPEGAEKASIQRLS